LAVASGRRNKKIVVIIAGVPLPSPQSPIFFPFSRSPAIVKKRQSDNKNSYLPLEKGGFGSLLIDVFLFCSLAAVETTMEPFLLLIITICFFKQKAPVLTVAARLGIGF